MREEISPYPQTRACAKKFHHARMICGHVRRNFAIPTNAGMAKLADAQDLGSCIARCAGSSPVARTTRGSGICRSPLWYGQQIETCTFGFGFACGEMRSEAEGVSARNRNNAVNYIPALSNNRRRLCRFKSWEGNEPFAVSPAAKCRRSRQANGITA